MTRTCCGTARCPALFGGIRAPTPGSHLRSCNWANVSQLEKAGREFLAGLARRAPLLLLRADSQAGARQS